MTIPGNASITDLELLDLARQHTQTTIDTLVEIAGDDNAPMASRIAAAGTLKRHRGLVNNFDELTRSGN